MSKAYFKESFKSGIKMMLFILIIGIIIYPLVILTTQFYQDNDYGTFYKTTSQVGLVITYLAILCYIVPIFKFSFLHKKRQIDYFYSLPIKRNNIININLLVGFLQIIIPYTIVYFLGMGLLALKTNIYHYVFYFPLYFISLYVALGVYLFNSFIFSRGNTISDGIILVILYTFVLGLFLSFLDCFKFIEIRDSSIGIAFVPFVNIGNYYNEFILYYGDKPLSGYYVNNFSNFNYFYPIILGIIGFLGLYFFTKIDKAERAEQITDSYFGYSVITPVYFVLLFVDFCARGPSIILVLLLIILYLIGEVIHYRKFKFPKKAYIIMASVIVGALVLRILTNFI